MSEESKREELADAELEEISGGANGKAKGTFTKGTKYRVGTEVFTVKETTEYFSNSDMIPMTHRVLAPRFGMITADYQLSARDLLRATMVEQ